MAPRSKHGRWAAAFAGFWILGVAVLASVCWRLHYYWERRVAVSASAINPSEVSADTLAYKALEAEFLEMQRRVMSAKELSRSNEGAQPGLDELSRDLVELKDRLKELRNHQEREAALLELSAQAASQTVSNIAGMVEYLSILFALVLFGATLITGLHTKEMRDEWHRVRDGLDKLEQRRSKSEEDLETVERKLQEEGGRARSAVEALQRAIDQSRRALDVEMRRIHEFSSSLATHGPEALSSVLNAWLKEAAISGTKASRIQRKINLFEARLKLLHPEHAVRGSAIDALGASGTPEAAYLLRSLLKQQPIESVEAVRIARAIRQNDEVRQRNGRT